ncbi:MAG: hypothetical protein AAFW83_10285 [Pseudomonadota bacterium]
MFKYDIFLSHTASDAAEADIVRGQLIEANYSVYCDRFDDLNLDRTNVTADTANTLRNRMRSCKSMVYVATSRAPKSKWMPWELGYFDGVRGSVLVYPVDDKAMKVAKNQQYLKLFTILEPGSLTDQIIEKISSPEVSKVLHNEDIFGPADHANTLGYSERLSNLYENPFDIEKVTKSNIEIWQAWMRFLTNMKP